MDVKQIQDWLDSLAPEERQQVLNALFGSHEDRREQFDIDQSRADELRREPMPGMRDTGRFVTAASPLEFLGTAAHRGLGEYRSRRIAEQREQMATEKERALQALVGQLLKSPAPTTPVPPMPGGTSPAGNVAALLRAAPNPMAAPTGGGGGAASLLRLLGGR